MSHRELRKAAATIEKEMKASVTTNLQERGVAVDVDDEDLYSKVELEKGKRRDGRSRDRSSGEKVLSRSIMKKVEAPAKSPASTPKAAVTPKSTFTKPTPRMSPNSIAKQNEAKAAASKPAEPEKKEKSGVPRFR